MNSKVTIAVPVFGVEQYIERCARSLFEQTCEDIEYLFVDDCSPDNSIDILYNVIHEYPDREEHVRIIHHHNNKGLAGARNTAVTNCQTEFIMHVDSDDYIALDTIEKVLKKQEETGSDIVSFNYATIQHNGNVTYNKFVVPQNEKDWVIQVLKKNIKCVVWSMLIRTSLYRDNSVQVVEGLNVGEDYQVSPQLFYFANKIVHLNDFLYFYMKNEESYTSSFSVAKAEQALGAVNVLKCFFDNKENQYIEAVIQGETKMLAMYMMGCARANQKKYGEEIRCKMNTIPRHYIKEIPINYKFVYYCKSFFILHYYSMIGHFINSIIR